MKIYSAEKKIYLPDVPKLTSSQAISFGRAKKIVKDINSEQMVSIVFFLNNSTKKMPKMPPNKSNKPLTKSKPQVTRPSTNEMMKIVEEKRKQKGIPSNAADRYKWLSKRHLTSIQKQAKEYLDEKGKDVEFLNEEPTHKNKIGREFQQHQIKKRNQRERKPNTTYSEEEYIFDSKLSPKRNQKLSSPVPQSPPSTPSTSSTRSVSPLSPENNTVSDTSRSARSTHSSHSAHSTSSQLSRSPSPLTRMTRSTTKKQAKDQADIHNVVESIESEDEVQEVEQEEQESDDTNDTTEEELVNYSIFDNFGNERKLTLDLNQPEEAEETFQQLFDRQCIQLEDKQIVVDDTPCRFDNMISLCLKKGSKCYLEDRLINVSFINENKTTLILVITVPSFTRIYQLKKLFDVPPQLRLYVNHEGTYLRPSTTIGAHSLNSIEIRAENSITVKSAHRIGSTFVSKELPPLESTDNLFENYFKDFFPKPSIQTGQLFYKRSGQTSLIPAFGATVEDVLQNGDEILMIDTKIRIFFEIVHLNKTDSIDLNSSSTIKDLIKLLNIDSHSFDVVRTIDNQILKLTDIIASCLMSGFAIRIIKKKPIASTIVPSLHFYVLKGKEFKCTQPFSPKTATVGDLVQYLSKEHPISLTQQWMLSFKRDQNEIPLSFFPEEANLSLVIQNESMLWPVSISGDTLHIRMMVCGVIYDKMVDPFETFKKNLIHCGHFVDPTEFDYFLEQPSDPNDHQMIDVERDMLSVEQNSLILIEKRLDI